MSDEHFTVESIGHVEADEGGFALVIAEPYRQALIDPTFREMTIAERPYRDAPAAIGVFATRSPARPNPIGLTAVPVISIDVTSGVVRIPYIDAEDGTPILDIKPYHPAVDRIRNVQTPAWCASWPEWYEDSATFDWGSVFENAQ
jgi:tRNA (Thr-GGU) A37 N-methylase